MNNFYSSLVINSKKFPHVHQVFKPLYNKEYFKRITANIDTLEEQVGKRCKHRPDNLSNESLNLIKNKSRQFVKLRETLERLDPEQDNAKYTETLHKLESLEDRIMPTVVSLPNRLSKHVPKEDVIVDEVESDFLKRQNLTKVLSHRKLSYINGCYSKSVVGPNSHYYFGIGAKLHHAISDYFATELERNRFIPFSGLCLVKTALVEASNTNETNDFRRDPRRILTDEPKCTTLHISEVSRESLLGFATTLGHIKSNDPVRLYSTGSCYRLGSVWFDGDEKHISQSETAHAMVINSSIETYSMNEYKIIKEIIWQIYKNLSLPTRLTHCSAESMHANEFDAHRIDIWLPSEQRWLQVGRISHYRDYLSIRVGMRRGHIIDSQLYDGQALVAAIIENRQTAQGKFIIPEVLRNSMLYLMKDEQDNYFEVVKPVNSDSAAQSMSSTKVLNNYEQRRYVAHRKYIFGHDAKGRDHKLGIRFTLDKKIFIVCVLLIYCFADFEEIWRSMIHDSIRQVLYDYFYRPGRRLFWWVAYTNVPVEKRPVDLSWAELDHSEDQISRPERYRTAILKNRYGLEGAELVKSKVDQIKQQEKALKQSKRNE